MNKGHKREYLMKIIPVCASIQYNLVSTFLLISKCLYRCVSSTGTMMLCCTVL